MSSLFADDVDLVSVAGEGLRARARNCPFPLRI